MYVCVYLLVLFISDVHAHTYMCSVSLREKNKGGGGGHYECFDV